jgi:protein-disulfide isomerase
LFVVLPATCWWFADVLSRGLLGASLAAAVVLAAGLIASSVVGARSDETPEAAVVAAELAGNAALLRGIPQDGPALGSPDAPVTLVEYADLQCPYCAQWSRAAFPELVRDYVRTGRVRMVFRGLAFVGPDSQTALRTALAAGEQDRLWDVVHLLYANQGSENGGWVTEDLLGRIGAALPGLNGHRMLEQRGSPQVEWEVGAAAAAAERDRIAGTPAFMLGPTGGTLEPVALTSLDAAPFRERLDGLLAP